MLAAGGGALTYISGFHRPFALTDLTISYPQKADIISIGVAAIIAVAIPAALIVLLSIAPPRPPIPLQTTKFGIWRRKCWDANAGLMGFGFSVAGTLLVTAGLKDLVGKPRPDLLARCDPDFSKISQFKVGGFGTSLDSEASALVTSGICQQTVNRVLDDGFAAFPSGHSSISWAGLFYFTLWLCWRYSIAIPYLGHFRARSASEEREIDELFIRRERRAAPPIWQVVLALVPTGVALVICGTRYADFHHAGVDITAGSIIGFLFAIAGFRLYHLPSGRGMGLTWAARKPYRAFMAGVSSRDFLNHDIEYAPRFSGGLSEDATSGAQLTRPTMEGEELTTLPSSVHSNRMVPVENTYNIRR